MTITTNQLVTVQAVELELQDDCQKMPGTILSRLRSKPPKIAKDSLDLLLKRDFRFFNNITPENPGEKQKFFDVAIFVAKLSLLSLLSTQRLASNTSQEYETQVKNLFEQAHSVLKNISSEVQLYIFRRLKSLYETIQNNGLKVACKLKAVDCLKQIGEALQKTTHFTSNFIADLKDYVRMAQQVQLPIDFTSFIKNTQKIYANQKNYPDQYTIMEIIFSAWEVVKKDVAKEDLEWLQTTHQNLGNSYAQLPTPLRNLLNLMREWLGLNEQYMGIFMKLSVGAGAITGSMVYGFGISLLNQIKPATEDLIKITKILNEQLGSLSPKDLLGLNIIKDACEKTLGTTDGVEAKRKLDVITTWLEWYPYYAAAICIISAASIYAASQPQEKAPRPLPSWVNQLAHENESLPHANQLKV